MTKKRGFTIIEVVLVLAIAGLIFMMVFVALPAMQRSQRDTQRRDDLTRLATAVIQYQGNNRGQQPWEFRQGSLVGFNFDSSSYDKFIRRYVDNESDDYRIIKDAEGVPNGAEGCTTDYMDPDGTCYGATVIDFGDPNKAGESQNIFHKIDDDEFNDEIYKEFSHIVLISGMYSRCGVEEQTIISTKGMRDFALFYMLEGGSMVCVDNS